MIETVSWQIAKADRGIVSRYHLRPGQNATRTCCGARIPARPTVHAWDDPGHALRSSRMCVVCAKSAIRILMKERAR